MNRIKKAAGANGGKTRERAERNSSLSSPNYTSVDSVLSILIDQALSRFEAHNDLARYHTAEAQKHRQILASLQRLIPQNFTRPGGAA